MGTSNFDNTRASCVYAVETSYYDEELEEEIYDDFAWEDARDNITYEMKNIAKKTNNKWQWSTNDEVRLRETLRSYPATSIGEFWSDLEYGGLYVRIEFILKTVAGYYDGFNLDYEVVLSDNYSYDPYEWEPGEDSVIEELIQEAIDQEPEKKGLFKMHAERFLEKFKERYEEGVNYIETIYKQQSTPLTIAARFSNGETFYEKCETKS
jgi:hypothetical protein